MTQLVRPHHKHRVLLLGNVARMEKNMISLDPDHTEKVYLMVHIRKDLCNRYVIRHWELHIIFSIARSIGTYIERSGIDQSCNRFHNILRFVDVFSNFPFTTSETMCDYY